MYFKTVLQDVRDRASCYDYISHFITNVLQYHDTVTAGSITRRMIVHQFHNKTSIDCQLTRK